MIRFLCIWRTWPHELTPSTHMASVTTRPVKVWAAHNKCTKVDGFTLHFTTISYTTHRNTFICHQGRCIPIHQRRLRKLMILWALGSLSLIFGLCLLPTPLAKTTPTVWQEFTTRMLALLKTSLLVSSDHSSYVKKVHSLDFTSMFGPLNLALKWHILDTEVSIFFTLCQTVQEEASKCY